MGIGTVERSPLRAARAWRRISLTAAARSSGIPLVQAEALESGDSEAFPNVEEMIASAVLYGATLGIGKDEALALLDRTIAGATEAETRMFGATGDMPVDAPIDRPLADFSSAVEQGGTRRPAPMAITGDAIDVTTVPLTPGREADVIAAPSFDVPAADASVEDTGAIQRVDAEDWQYDSDGDDAAGVGDIADSGVWSGGAITDPRDEAADAAEDAWSFGDVDRGDTVTRSRPATGAGRWIRHRMDLVLGERRSSALKSRVGTTRGSMGESIGSVRTRLQDSEHGTLILAIGVGVVLIALLVAISAAIGGGGSKPAPLPKVVTPTQVVVPAVHSTAKGAVVPPKDITVDVDNAGSVHGKGGQLAYKIKGLGYRIGKIGNAAGSTYASSIILYPKGLQREALVLSKQTGITTMDTLPGTSPGSYLKVVVF